MSDSNEPDPLAAKHDRNREQRIEAIKQWVAYIREHPAESWGEQQNRLVNSQIESAQASGIDVDHRRRVDESARDR